MSLTTGKLRDDASVRVFGNNIVDLVGDVEKAVILNHLAFQMARAIRQDQIPDKDSGMNYYLSSRTNFLSKLPTTDSMNDKLNELIEDGIVGTVSFEVGKRTIEGYFIDDEFILGAYNLIDEGDYDYE